jgi:hypothetical protein
MKGIEKMNVNKRLNVNFRAGYRLNVIEVLQEMEDKYRTMLNMTVENFDSYDEISSETYNDAIVFKAELGVLLITGYLNEDEVEAMNPIVDQIRMEILSKLEKEGEKDGSEKENI